MVATNVFHVVVHVVGDSVFMVVLTNVIPVVLRDVACEVLLDVLNNEK